jgi:hypothetical protein
MTAELIQFARLRDDRRGHLYRQQPVPRVPSANRTPPSVVELQVARIARLLGELEELTETSIDVPAATLTHARASLDKARRIIRPWTALDELDGDPQPDVDDERLERMYRDLNRDA